MYYRKKEKNPPPSRRVKVKRVRGGIVLWQKDGLEGGEVGQKNPIPACDENILQLDVSVADTVLVGLLDGQE